jgi:hypothetical protein
MYKVSDFSLATSILQAACNAVECPFVDLEVRFCNQTDLNMEESKFEDGKIICKKTENMPESVYNIVSVYLNNFNLICGTEVFVNDNQKVEVLVSIANFLRNVLYGSDVVLEKLEKPVIQRIYQYPMLWIILNDIICPLNDITFTNYEIVLYNSPYVDTSLVVDDVIDDSNDDIYREDQVIFLNADVSYKPCKMACLVKSGIEIHGLNCKDVLKSVLESNAREKLLGAAKLCFNDKDEEYEDFVVILEYIAGISNDIEKTISDTKTAQREQLGNSSAFSDGLNSTWWFLGVIERLLEPVRGSDWSTYTALEPIHKALWDKIEKKRKEKGREGLTYEALLRVRSEETKPEDIKLIEKNLSSDRVW